MIWHINHNLIFCTKPIENNSFFPSLVFWKCEDFLFSVSGPQAVILRVTPGLELGTHSQLF